MRYLILCTSVFLMLTACSYSKREQPTITAAAFTVTSVSLTHPSTATSTATSTHTPHPTGTPTPAFTPTPVSSPTATRDPNRFYASDGTFSLLIPEGWKVADAGMAYPALISTEDAIYPPNIFFYTDSSAYPVAFYAAGAQDSLAKRVSNLNNISEEFGTTPGGKDYFRWELRFTQNDVAIHSIVYFFEVGEWKLIVTYSRQDNQGIENDALVENAMGTITLNP